MPIPYSNTKEARLNAMIARLKRGPGDLAERSSFTPGGDAGEEARQHLNAAYQLWVHTWILPVIEDLRPKKKAKK